MVDIDQILTELSELRGRVGKQENRITELTAQILTQDARIEDLEDRIYNRLDRVQETAETALDKAGDARYEAGKKMKNTGF